jgi:hypothetical protein
MTASLAIAIRHALLHNEPARTETPKCFAYGRPFTEANAEEDER